MSVRFRIRTSAGQELSFATHEMFEDFVRSGDLAPDDLVYDVETGEWAPARTVPLVLDIEYEKEAAEEAAAAGEVEPTGESPATTAAEAQAPDETEVVAPAADGVTDGDGAFGLSLAPEHSPADAEEATGAEATDRGEEGEADDSTESDLGLELAPEQDVSREDAAQAFVDKMEAERRDEIEVDIPDHSASIRGFTMEDSSSLADLTRAADPPSQDPPRFDQPKKAKIARPPKPPKKNSLSRVAMVVVGLGLVGGGVWIGMQLMGGGSIGVGAVLPDSAGAAPVDTTPPPPPPRVPVIASTESAVRERAQELLLTATQVLFRDHVPIPEVWPTGEYLSAPSAHADVLEVWSDYLRSIREVRGGDADRYRDAYERALDDAVIEGEARESRLAVAMAAFATRDSLRAGHFDRVEALATAAIQSHNALLEAEGLITFDATGSTGVRSGIGRGTAGRDSDAQLLLDQVLDLLSSTLDADGLGPRDARTVREWVWDGYLDAVTN